MRNTKKNTIKIRKAELRDAATIAAYNIKMAMETENMELDADTISRGVKAIIKDPHK
ncbi:MAG: N-acetyltransferase, partial [bacterium]|nr:N-acetyltransferase [bacterium]